MPDNDLKDRKEGALRSREGDVLHDNHVKAVEYRFDALEKRLEKRFTALSVDIKESLETSAKLLKVEYAEASLKLRELSNEINGSIHKHTANITNMLAYFIATFIFLYAIFTGLENFPSIKDMLSHASSPSKETDEDPGRTKSGELITPLENLNLSELSKISSPQKERSDNNDFPTKNAPITSADKNAMTFDKVRPPTETTKQ